MDLIERGAAIDALNDYLIGKRCFDNGTMMAQFIERNVLRKLPPAQPEELDTLIKALEAEHKKLREMQKALKNVPDTNVGETISRQAAIDAFDGVKVDEENCTEYDIGYNDGIDFAISKLSVLPPARPTQLTDDDIETIRIHLSAFKENLCNQHRWNEAKEYEALIDRLTAQPGQRTGKWILDRSGAYCCSECMEPCAGYVMMKPRDKFCKMCGAKMEV